MTFSLTGSGSGLDGVLGDEQHYTLVCFCTGGTSGCFSGVASFFMVEFGSRAHLAVVQIWHMAAVECGPYCTLISYCMHLTLSR